MLIGPLSLVARGAINSGFVRAAGLAAGQCSPWQRAGTRLVTGPGAWMGRWRWHERAWQYMYVACVG